MNVRCFFLFGISLILIPLLSQAQRREAKDPYSDLSISEKQKLMDPFWEERVSSREASYRSHIALGLYTGGQNDLNAGVGYGLGIQSYIGNSGFVLGSEFAYFFQGSDQFDENFNTLVLNAYVGHDWARYYQIEIVTRFGVNYINSFYTFLPDEGSVEEPSFSTQSEGVFLPMLGMEVAYPYKRFRLSILANFGREISIFSSSEEDPKRFLQLAIRGGFNF